MTDIVTKSTLSNIVNDTIVYKDNVYGVNIEKLKTLIKNVTIASGRFENKSLVQVLSTGDEVPVDMTAVLKAIGDDVKAAVIKALEDQIIPAATEKTYQAAYSKLLDSHYQVKDISEAAYTTVQGDFNGFTYLRITGNSNATVTLIAPENEALAKGRKLVIRNALTIKGEVVPTVTIKQGTGVTISPADATLLRRPGSLVTLVYVGNNTWDISGELP